jgi:hypothetical protein
MAADYVVEYSYHIDERKRPEGFPKIVYVIDHYQNIENEAAIVELYNNRFRGLAKEPGVVVFLDQNKIDSSKVNFDSRVFVPWHMICFAHGKVTLIIPEEPKKDDLALEPEENSDKKATVM